MVSPLFDYKLIIGENHLGDSHFSPHFGSRGAIELTEIVEKVTLLKIQKAGER